MAVSKSKKSEILAGLVNELNGAKSVGFSINSGLTVAEITTLRKDLREADAKFVVAKKTLMKLAMKEVFDVEMTTEMLPSSIAMVICKGDAVEGLGKVNSQIKTLGEEKISWASSYFEGELKGTEDTKTIASLPSRETLLGRLVGSLMSPLSSLARFADAAATEVEAQGKENLSQIEKKAEDTAE